MPYEPLELVVFHSPHYMLRDKVYPDGEVAERSNAAHC